MKYILYEQRLNIFQVSHPEGGPGNAMQTNNPDFDDLYPKVAWWMLEFDEDTRVINREIGLDKEKDSIVFAPWGCNFGLWVDSLVAINDIEYEDSTEVEFEKKWLELKDKLEK